jgi:trans-aconitate methyltransferase
MHGIDMSQAMIDLSRSQVHGGIFEQANMPTYVPTEKYNGIFAILSLFLLSRREMEATRRGGRNGLFQGGGCFW